MMISAYTGGPIIDSVLEGSHVGLNINFFGSSGADIYRSTLSGDIAALELPDDTEFDGNVNVIFSRFDGPLIVPVTVEGNISCAAVIDQTDTFFANQCPP